MTDSIVTYLPMIGLLTGFLLVPVALEEIYRRNRRARLAGLNLRHVVNPERVRRDMEARKARRPVGARARQRANLHAVNMAMNSAN